jgi:hypothetical protein
MIFRADNMAFHAKEGSDYDNIIWLRHLSKGAALHAGSR